MRQLGMLAAALAAACAPEQRAPDSAAGDAASEAAAAPAAPRPAEPPPLRTAPPGTAGGLPDDRTPTSEAPTDERSAEGAAQVVQRYFALVEAGRNAEARALADGPARGADEAAFAARFAPFAEYHAEVGAPGRVEGAAGSLYVEVPVQIYGRTRGGEPFARGAVVTLRRCNDVPGCSETERRWRIVGDGLD